MRCVLAWALAAAAVALTACTPIVGGTCRTGAIPCDGVCVDPLTDERACGACGVACSLGRTCVEGRCTGRPEDADVLDGDVLDSGPRDAGPLDGDLPDGDLLDGDLPDGDLPDGDLPDGDLLDGATPDGGPRDAPGLDAPAVDGGGIDAPVDAPGADGGPGADAGPVLCDLGQELCAGVCVDVRTDVRNCGSCGMACGAAQFCELGGCVDLCSPGLSICGRACVDLSSDPDNCGVCGRVCPTGLCDAGECVGALAGHVVLLGHSYEVHRAAMDRLLGNAVLLTSARPARVLPFEGTALPVAIAGARRAIDDTALALGRTVTWLPSTDESGLPSALADADVLLVYAQASGTDADITRIGTNWSLALDTFLLRGGVVVVLDAAASHRGTWGILEAAALLNADRHEVATGATVRIVAPADGMAIGVPLTYRAERDSVRYVGIDLPVVASDTSGPVVLHLTVVP
jgi:hypothetical protein